MTFLRHLLKVQAALWLVFGLAIALVPRAVFEGVFGQPVLTDYAVVRAAGVMAIVLAMLMVLVSQKLEDVWWWAWTFALLEAGTAAIFLVNAVWGVPHGAPAWPWWALAVTNAVIGALELVAIGRTAQDRPFA